MVDDDVLLVDGSETVPAVAGSAVGHLLCDILVARTETHEAYDHVVGRDGKLIFRYTYTVAGCCLASYGHIAVAQLEFAFKMNCTVDVKYDGAGTFLFTSPAE